MYYVTLVKTFTMSTQAQFRDPNAYHAFTSLPVNHKRKPHLIFEVLAFHFSTICTLLCCFQPLLEGLLILQKLLIQRLEISCPPCLLQ